ncbi:uncharacterized protein LOC121367343 isoform X2 [Gigantopelta aegis]|uniref:uncharacterized protein LOC121367343 isoform X2 n=1 Tax=Gigantopelta aegis TaxID=1735272 RepID=UPI001B8892F2|nr:uncharacterized protein LOC121367343 isoform X2 [Gigantopelta aegis]
MLLLLLHQDTDRLDVDAVKQKTSLRKKGSLALRKKPTRSSMKRCVSESEESRFVDSTEPKPVSNGVQDDENDEMFKKPQTKSPARSAVPSLSQINKPRAPPGAFVPSLNQINTSKVLSGSSKKSGGGSSVKKETSRFTDHTNNHLVQADDNNSQSENEMKAKLKPVVRQSSNDTSSSSKPKLVFESQHSGNENIFPKLKPVSTSQKPKPNNASSNGTKPKVHPRTVTKRVSKDQKDSQNQFSAGKCLPSDASLDTKFNELATRIEQVEESTHNKPAVDQSPSDKALTDGILSPTAFKQRHKPRTSSSSSDGARCDATSSHKVSGEQIKTAGRKVSFDESSCKPLQQAELVRPSQKAEIVKPSQQSEVVKPSQESKVVKPSQKAEVVKPSQQADVVKPSQQADVVKPSQQADVVKPSQQANIVKPSQQADVVKPAWKASLTEHQQREVKGDGVDRQPAWVTRKLKCTDDLSRKMLQEQEPEKPAWFKAAQEKKQRAAEIVMAQAQKKQKTAELVIAQENRNQENKARKIDEDEEKKPSPWLGERQLRKTPRTKPLTENQDNNSGEMTPQTPQPSNKRVNSSTDNTTLTPDNTHDRLSPLKTTKTEDSTSATSTVKDDYAPSWMRGNKLKSVSTPNLHHVPRVSGESGVGGEIPQWKRELVNRKKIRRESDVQTDANKDESTEDTSPGVIWKSQLKKKRLPSTSKAEVDKTVSKEPEWKRAAEEKRTRFLKSGMIEQK